MTPNFIKNPDDLVTCVQATQNGFLKQALRKTQEANPYVREGRRLQKTLAKIKEPYQAFGVAAIESALLAACGFSEKSLKYFNKQERELNLGKVLALIASEAGDTWREELVYRFVLTRGDALGGAMRNIIGAEATTAFAAALQDALRARGKKCLLLKVGADKKIAGIAWANRMLVFDKTPLLPGDARGEKKNIDVILMDSGITRLTPSLRRLQKILLGNPKTYLACGELKGGIDPAGADEHWKTAASALERIRSRFPQKPPRLFFAGAAIAKAMAVEIHRQLQDGRLTHAANLTVPQQLDDLAGWLVSL